MSQGQQGGFFLLVVCFFFFLNAMTGCHADKATETLRALLLKAPRPVDWGRHCGEAWTGDQGTKPGGYSWVDTVSLMLLMDCPTGAPADWHQAWRSSTG